ncbi:MAG: sulfur carrier protein ThiS [Deltaproteobacteria bacterium]|nr:sulfur carrier protein ThiS [Deltaproteobacteria bacterium]
MIIRVNGEERIIEDGTTIEALLNELKIKPQAMAVDLNREIIPKRLYNNTMLKDGDSLEIVRMTGGG